MVKMDSPVECASCTMSTAGKSNQKLYTNYCHVRKHFFCNHIVAVWNELKINPCDIKTLRAFKIF